MKSLITDLAEDIFRIELNRPDDANTVNLEMAGELMDVVSGLERNAKVRAVVVTGSPGRFFCGGGDLRGFDPLSSEAAIYLKKVTTSMHSAIARLTRINAPVIAAVNGSVAGAGFSLVCACDFVIFSETASLTPAYSNVALNPDGGLSWFLPRLVGTRKALEIIMLNKKLSADDALNLGIATESCPTDQVTDRALQLASTLAKGPTLAFGELRRLIYASLHTTIDEQLERETAAISRSVGTEDFQTSISAFLTKTHPQFTGR